MGDFRIVIDAVGGHGLDRDKENGEIVDFQKEGPNSPEALAVEFVKLLHSKGVSINGAKVIHWPHDNYPDQRDASKVLSDDLLTGVRTGSFKEQH